MRMGCSDVQWNFLVILIMLYSNNICTDTLTTNAEQQTSSPRLLPDFVNLTHLALEYALTCGSAHTLCNAEEISFKMPMSLVGDCPPIKNCDKNCAMSQLCSPDLENAFINVSCSSTVLYSPKKSHMHTYMMVDTCNGHFPTASSEYVELCNKVDEINEYNFFNETFRPVFSMVTGITYRNKFCALCNVDGKNFNQFQLEMKCDKFLDINSFSSLQDMWEAIKTFNCSVSYVPPFEVNQNVSKCYFSSHYTQLRQCNTTCLWSKYDPQIEWACENFNSSPYKGYNNIFCYICNPGLASTQTRRVIDTCNVTGEWRHNATEIENACLQLPLTERTFPFKNKFCQLCNVNSNGFRTYGNFSVFIEDAFDGRINNFYYGRFEHITDEILTDKETANRSEETLGLNQSTGAIKVLQEVGNFCGFANFCSTAYAPVLSIHKACFFSCSTDKNCCDQLSEKYNPATLSAYTQCDSEGYTDFFTEMCEKGLKNDIFSVIPVKSSNTKRVHKNAFCARCSNDFGELDLRSFSISCPQPLEAALFVTFTELQTVVNANDCNVTLNYPQAECDTSSSIISYCRNREHWEHHNIDLLNNCERQEFINFNFGHVCFNGSLYRNIFCLICNRDWVESEQQDIISECNATGNWFQYDSVLEEMCQNQPYYPGWYPFKNIYCASCNLSPLDTELRFEPEYISVDSGIHVCSGFSCILSNAPYRILFSLTDLNFPSNEGIAGQTDEFCAEGKTLIDGECRVVLEETVNLGYNTTYGIRVINSSHVYWPEPDLRNISTKCFEHDALLQNGVEILQLNINEVNKNIERFALINETGPADAYNDSEWRVNALLFFAETDNRTEIEKTLIAMRETVLSIFLYDQEFTVQTYPINDQAECRHGFRSQEQPFEEIKVTKIDNEFYDKHQYGYQLYNDTDISSRGITFSTVNEMLFCVLRKIDSDIEGFIETLCKMNITFKLTTDPDKIYVCANDFGKILSNNTVKATPFTVIYGIFSIVCTLLSVSCLFLTFLTYVLFKSLRTVPGKNNMILAFTLFWAQLFLQFGLWQNTVQPVCVFLGVTIHYFWLTAFCAMNVCSMHMFKVFHSPMMVSRNTGKKATLYYSLYTFATPLVFISIFIIVILVQSDFKKVGYGNRICFLSDFIHIVIMFIIPACVIIVINAVLCGVAYWYIRSSPRVEGSVDRNDFKIYLKLTTITGTAWVFLFIDTLNPLSVFSYVAATAGALQGVYIFIAFICNKKVLSLYKDRFQRKAVHGQRTQRQTLSDNKLLSTTMSSEWIRKQLESSKETFI